MLLLKKVYPMYIKTFNKAFKSKLINKSEIFEMINNLFSSLIQI